MIEALHIVDNRARPDILEQLDMLAGAGERILSAGPPPAGMTRPVKPVHCTMGSARLAGWRMRELAGTAQVIHAWSAQALWAGRELALATGRALVLTIPAAPTTPDDWKTLRQAVGPGLVNVVAPTDFARRQLIEQISGLQLTSQTTVRDFVTQRDEIMTQINSIIAGSVVEDRKVEGEVATVIVSVGGPGVWSVLHSQMTIEARQ